MRESARLKRVLFAAGLDPSMKFSSTEEQIFLLAQAFQSRSSLFLPVYQSKLSTVSAAEYAAAGLQVEDINLTAFRFAALQKLLVLVRSHKIEVVHWNFYSPLFNWYVWWLTLLRPRLEHYFTDHASREVPLNRPEGFAKTAIKRFMFRRYRTVLSGSDYMVGCLRKDRTWKNPSRWYYGVNTDRFKPDAATRARIRTECGAENQFVALFVGNLIQQKGVDVAVRALLLVPDPIVLWVVGGGPEAEQLQRLCRELSLQHRVRFFGLQRNVESYMQAADCLVCPSMWVEAAGQVNMEALGCGIPVVASRIGGIPEFVEDNQTGMLFTPGDAREFAQKLHSLAYDPVTRARIAASGRRRAVEQFSMQKCLDACLDLYRE